RPSPSPTPTQRPLKPAAARALTVYCDATLPRAWREALQNALAETPVACVDDPAAASVRLMWRPLSQLHGDAVITRFYAVAAPFATVQDDVSLPALQAFWMGEGGPLIVAEEAVGPLQTIFDGSPAHTAPAADLLARLQEDEGALGILPFDLLDPAFKTLTVDGRNILDKGLQAETYPLAVGLSVSGPDAKELIPIIRRAIQPATNRDTDRMTTLIMTGVTAMARGVAAKMEQKGVLYPALVISDTLAAADITHVSNEAPFIKGCQVNNTYMNLTLCSDYPYIQALKAIGVDIVGLSGNHVNDFGREGARESLQFYKDQGMPIYGSGLNEEEACRPLLWEDHGNTYAFIATLAWWPEDAWATATEPGACYYYRNYDRIFDMVRQLSQQVDIVSVELQFEETYAPWPTEDQVKEFRALHDAGADIVTGVQSHVPQAVEPYSAREPGGPAIILYGLGNLFFDQMQSWETRTGLIARHTIYEGRLLNTELLTTVLEDFAQPRWAAPQERAEILRAIFDAAPPKNGDASPAKP
ncbi:MAG TPA: CapA family protein, partial [Caldilineae bacterium]|nr:CapA family protein [Caldilineae bacterium]